MIGNRLEQEIIAIFGKDLKAAYTINQISHILKRAYPYINKKVNGLIAEGVLKKQVVGNSYLCSLNSESIKSLALLQVSEALKTDSLQKTKECLPFGLIKKIRENEAICCAILHNDFLYVIIRDNECKAGGKPDFTQIQSLAAGMKVIIKNKAYLKEQLAVKGILTPDEIVIFGFEWYFQVSNEILSNQ